MCCSAPLLHIFISIHHVREVCTKDTYKMWVEMQVNPESWKTLYNILPRLSSTLHAAVLLFTSARNNYRSHQSGTRAFNLMCLWIANADEIHEKYFPCAQYMGAGIYFYRTPPVLYAYICTFPRCLHSPFLWYIYLGYVHVSPFKRESRKWKVWEICSKKILLSM